MGYAKLMVPWAVYNDYTTVRRGYSNDLWCRAWGLMEYSGRCAPSGTGINSVMEIITEMML